jgi:hypothetical protein
MTDTCPTCGQPVSQPIRRQRGKRICSLCNGKIGRFHKWQFGEDSRPQHKDCSVPTGTPVAETMNLPI